MELLDVPIAVCLLLFIALLLLRARLRRRPAAGTPPKTDAAVEREVRAILRASAVRGRRVLAVRRTRQLTGMGLDDARAYVETVERRMLHG